MNQLYDIGFVAFIDILGWSSIVDKSAIETEWFSRLDGLLETIKAHSEIQSAPTTDPGVQISQISDSIFVTVNVARVSQRPERISLYSTLIARECFSRGMLTRGGITLGEFRHDGSKLFGPAVVRAFQIEQAVQYPCIAIDPSPIVVNEFLDSDEYGFHISTIAKDKTVVHTPVSISPIAKTSGETFFIDWMREDISDDPKYGPRRVYNDEEKARSLNEILSNKHSISVRPKIDWFRRYADDGWRKSCSGEFVQVDFRNDRDVARWVKSDDYYETFRHANLTKNKSLIKL